MNATTPPATIEERLHAIENMLRYMLETMECETSFTAEALVNWIALCRERERTHNIADTRAQVVFSQLCERLLLIESEDTKQEPDLAARKAALAAIQKLRRPPAN